MLIKEHTFVIYVMSMPPLQPAAVLTGLAFHDRDSPMPTHVDWPLMPTSSLHS